MKRNCVVLVLMAVLISVTGCPAPSGHNPTLTDISANYTGTMPIYPDTPLDELKDSLTVTATYSNDASNILNAADYTLSGILAVGTSTITVTYEDKTTVFTVTVSARNPIESPSMQVYNSDKTTLYDGGDLNFYIQGDDTKKVTATIKDGKLVITYNPLPESCQLNSLTYGQLFSSPTNIMEGLKYHEIILISDNSKKLLYRIKETSNTTRQVRIIYFNMDGSFKAGNVTVFDYSVKQGWNFVFQGAWTDPEHFKEGYCWVVE